MARTRVVMCIDDDPPVLSAIRRLLRNEPYELITTVDPRRVLEVVSERHVDLIVADQRMPSMPGTELLKQIREKSPGTIGVILTGHADLSDIAGAMNEGAVDRLIRKPWDDEDFRRMIRGLLDPDRKPGMGAVPAEEASSPRDGAASPPETIQRQVDCSGRRTAEVLTEITDLICRPEGPPERVVIVFENLLAVIGSLNVLLLEVVRMLVKFGVRAALIDGSGAAGTFLELVGGRIPVVVYSSTSEMSAPKSILVVEDHPENLEYLRALIESAGHRCDAVGSVAEAVRRLKDARFDLVLLDLMLPDADGVEVARYILDRGLKVPVIAVSGFLDRWGDESFSEVGIRRQVSKPYRAREILDAIRDS
ncbi:MAG TPA: response regulator [Planctomycetota bacterium]|nr:response regulator [Planctomycetota bacterium]